MPNRNSRPVTPAPVGTLCGFNRQGLKCMGGHPGPGKAVHVLTHSLPIAPAGTALCAFHSPYDVLRRWDVTLSPDNRRNGRDVHTFTWGVTRHDAMHRVITMMDATDDDGNGMWDGWSFTLADAPTPNVHA